MRPTLTLMACLLALPALPAAQDPLLDVAAGLASGIRKQGAVKVAVLGLVHHDNHASDGPALLSDRLTSGLSAQKKIAVVERERLAQALDELRLGQSGQLDPQTVKSVGAALGADVVVTGTIINLPEDKSEVNARALLAKNGRVIAAGRTVVDRTWIDRRGLALRIPGGLSSDAIRAIARKVVRSLKDKPSPALAILNFPYSRNRSSTGSHVVSERLTTFLVQEGGTVIERRLLDRLLQERKLWETGLVEPGAMRNVGSVLGADAIVTGFLNDLSETTTEVLVRVVKIDTGEIVCAISGVVQRIWSDAPRLPRIAQPRSAVPVAGPPIDSIQEPAPVRRPRPGERRRYYPAPVPFVLPASSNRRGNP